MVIHIQSMKTDSGKDNAVWSRVRLCISGSFMFNKECVERLRARCVNGSLELGGGFGRWAG